MPNPGLLPADFHFTQSCLQDFRECPRRFQLRHIQRCAWPAVISEPVLAHENRMLLGNAFHRLVQQHQAGIAPERITAMLEQRGTPESIDLLRWWKNYLAFAPLTTTGKCYPEYSLGASVAGFRLIAKIDLIVVEPNDEERLSQVTILDWKTNLRRAKRADLLASWQTRVYRHLLVRAGSHLNGSKPILPGQMRMIYWYTEHPNEPECLDYSPDQYQEDERDLSSMIMDIAGRRAADFPMALQERSCRFCVYRSLCDRGVQAGAWDDDEQETSSERFSLDLDQVAEVVF